MKALKFLFLLLLTTGFSFAQVDHFYVQVNPNTLKPNESSDLVIKALDDKGDVVKDYNGSILIEIDGLTDRDVTIPNDGFYEFATDDKGQKTFSKGLIFKKEGDYKVNITDLSDDNIKGNGSVSVKSSSTAQSGGTVEILSPIEGSIEKSSSVKITANSTQPNTPFEIYIDDKKVKDGIADDNGGINSTVNDLKSGSHKLLIKLTDIDGKAVGDSQPVTFSVATDSTDLFKGLDLSPSGTVNKNSTVKFTLTTLESVTSAQLAITGLGNYPMDSAGKGKFTKEVLFDKVGTFDVGVKLSAADTNKDYSNKATVIVKEKAAIKEVKVTKDKNKLNLEWTYVGNISKFKVLFGTGNGNMTGNSGTGIQLSGSLIVDKAVASLDNVDPLTTYFIKVQPIDGTGTIVGDESQLIVVEPNTKGAASCQVKGIKLTPKQEGSKYYLTWNAVDGATKYVFYKSDSVSKDFSGMKKVGETQETRFEYPFDPKAKKDTYAYYGVEAECNDGVKAPIDSIKKVKVGPFDTLIFIILVSSFMYLVYRLYYYAK